MEYIHPSDSLLDTMATSNSSLAQERAEYLAGLSEPKDVDLLALLLGGQKPHDTARELLRNLGGLRGLTRATAAEIRASGVPAATACRIAAALELGRRGANLAPSVQHPIHNAREAALHVRYRVGYMQKEVFLAIGLDARNRVKLVETVAIGSLASVEVHPREVFAPMVRSGVHVAIVAHNHPSGVAKPSDADLDLTARLVAAGRILGVPVVDHVIVTDTDYFSLAAAGQMGAAE